jgi:hypothetical protein
MKVLNSEALENAKALERGVYFLQPTNNFGGGFPQSANHGFVRTHTYLSAKTGFPRPFPKNIT